MTKMPKFLTSIISGASPVRKDFGRGFTASQWARFCGRYMCAESIEKFVRTAVPGGAALISDSSGSIPGSLGLIKSSQNSHQQSLHHSKIRSRSASGSSKIGSWLTRTLRKAFNSTGDESDLSVSKPNKSFRCGLRQSRQRNSSKKCSSKNSSSGGRLGMAIPQVEVTLTSSSLDSPDSDTSKDEPKDQKTLGKKSKK